MEATDDQEALNKAILQSLQSSNIPGPILKEPSPTQDDDEDLKRAISMSLEADAEEPSPKPIQPILPASEGDPVRESLEFIRQRRLMRLEQPSQSNSPQN